VRAPAQLAADVRTWLRDAVSRLAAVFPTVQAQAVSRRRLTGALDVLGMGVAIEQRDGIVLSVRDDKGLLREQVTSDLTQAGILTAVRAIGGGSQRREIEFPPPEDTPLELRAISETELKNRLATIQRVDQITSSRIVYSAALIDIDDVDVWSLAPDHDRHTRVRRILQRATRAAWNGARPVVENAERGWVGDLDDPDRSLTEADVTAASTRVLQALTPGQFPLASGATAVILEPALVAQIADVVVRELLSVPASRRPEVLKRTNGAIASSLVTLVDDPTEVGTYGSLPVGDLGELTAPVALIDQGQPSPATLTRERRAGHIGELLVAPTHLRVSPGTLAPPGLLGEGWWLEGRVSIAYDAASDRLVLAVARAREIKGGSTTGRVFPDVELAGSLTELLESVDAVTADSATTILREDVAGEPRWRSITAPWWRTKGVVRPRRGVG
jgi:predicted Zn-dependent protease